MIVNTLNLKMRKTRFREVIRIECNYSEAKLKYEYRYALFLFGGKSYLGVFVKFISKYFIPFDAFVTVFFILFLGCSLPV